MYLLLLHPGMRMMQGAIRICYYLTTTKYKITINVRVTLYHEDLDRAILI